MKKRLISLCLLLALVLCGCGKKPGAITDPANQMTTGPQSSGTAEIDYHQEILSHMYEIPEYNATPLIAYDPERQVYISLANQDCDFYPKYVFTGLMFWVITKEQYDKSQITVQLPSQTSYTVHVEDMTHNAFEVDPEYPSGRHGIYGLTHWQGFTLLGADWRQIGQEALYRKAAARLAESYEPGSAEYEGFQKAATENTSDLWIEYIEKFKKITNEELPKFSCYRVSINFSDLGSYEETVETADITVGDNTYTVEFGQWRLHTEFPDEIKDAYTEKKGLSGSRVRIAFTEPVYTDGYASLGNTFVFTVQESLTVLGLHQLDTEVPEIPVIGAKVRILEEGLDGQFVTIMDYYWDTEQPLTFEPGTTVAIDLYVKDDRFCQYEFCFTACFFMDYEIRDKQYQYPSPMMLNCIHDNVWDTYLLAFEGVDVGEYYTCYVYPTSYDWVREIPAE